MAIATVVLTHLTTPSQATELPLHAPLLLQALPALSMQQTLLPPQSQKNKPPMVRPWLQLVRYTGYSPGEPEWSLNFS